MTADAELINGYLQDMRWRRLAATTIAIREDYLTHLSNELGPLSKVKPGKLRAWLADPKRGTSGGLKATSQSTYLTTYHGFYVWAIKAKKLKKDPTLRVDKPKVSKGFPHPIIDDDLEKVLANADPMVRCWLSLGAYAGARCCEIAGVSREDVFDDESMRLYLAHTKGDKPRWVPLSQKLLDALNDWGMPGAGPLWDLNAAQMSKALNAHLHTYEAKRDDGRPATAHCLRHWYGSTLYQLTNDIVMVKELMGHESVATTQIYAGTRMDKASEWVRKL